MTQMNAALFYAPQDVRFERVPIPEPAPGEVLVKVRAALTCGTDIKTYQRGHPAIIKKVPSTFGHEFSGEVVRVGEGVAHFEPGTRVTCCNAAPCNKCFYCINGQHNLCDDLLVLNGAYAEYIVVPRRLVNINLLPIPDHLSYQEAALSEPLGTAVHALRLTPVAQADTLAVIGTGPLGLMIVRLATLKGARVVAIGKGEERLATARAFGAAETIDITSYSDVDERITAARELTDDNLGFDVVVEAVGLPAAWEEALRLVRKGGRVTFFGGCKSGTSIKLDTVQLHYDELQLLGVFHQTPDDYRRALHLLSARLVDGRKFVKETVPLSHLLEAFTWVKELKAIKYAIDPKSM